MIGVINGGYREALSLFSADPEEPVLVLDAQFLNLETSKRSLVCYL
jgi:hypothetical protein